MIRLIDNSKAVEISIRDWDEENTQYSPDWSADFFEVGGLKTVDVPDLAYIVEDVDYCIEQANDMVTLMLVQSSVILTYLRFVVISS